jgi:hypothetical protein
MTRTTVALRSALASGVATLALLAGTTVGGCGTAPDALRNATLANNAAAAVLNAARAAHELALAADMRARFAACPESPQAERQACVHDAAVAAMAAVQVERAELANLALVEGVVADALEAAAQCRAAQTTCEAGYVQDAERALATVQAGLVRRALDAGTEGGGTP